VLTYRQQIILISISITTIIIIIILSARQQFSWPVVSVLWLLDALHTDVMPTTNLKKVKVAHTQLLSLGFRS